MDMGSISTKRELEYEVAGVQAPVGSAYRGAHVRIR